MSQIEVGSLFAGIGGFDLAAERAGFRVAWQAEIDKYSSQVLDYRWPDVPNLGDINEIRDPQWVDILVGGFPCQSYSVAGNRGGLSDDRGALWWQYHRLIDSIRPTWVVGENVPGLLSSAGGRDFETIIRSLTEIGYGVVWSVLDSQHFGVPQRRRRVFIVAHSGGKPRPEILALSEGMFGHSEESRKAQQDIAATLEQRPTADRLRAEEGHIIGPLTSKQGPARLDNHAVDSGQIIGFSPAATDVVNVEDGMPTLTGRHGDPGAIVHAPKIANSLMARDDKGPRQDTKEPNMITYVSKMAQTGSNGLGISGADIDGEETTHTLDSAGPEAVVTVTSFAENQRGEVREDDVMQSLVGGGGKPGMGYPAVLQVFEDDRRSGPRMHDEVSPTLTARMGQGGNNMPMVAEGEAVPIQNTVIGRSDEAGPAGKGHGDEDGAMFTLDGSGPHAVGTQIAVRKLTPLECERLQGFPDGWTGIPKMSDTQRYKQLGNAVTVNTVEWIMRRIAATYDPIYLDPQEAL